MLPLEGKVAIITGGTSGIGARTAEVFVANGAKVVIAGRRQDRGHKLAGKLGDAASFIRTDVSVEADVKAMVDHAVERFGRLDCLMNNAGRSSQYAAIADVNLEQFDAVIAVHLRAVLAGMKYAVRVMADKERAASSTLPVSMDSAPDWEDTTIQPRRQARHVVQPWSWVKRNSSEQPLARDDCYRSFRQVRGHGTRRGR